MWRAIVLVILIDAVFLWPFAYRNGYGHGDVSAMQMALYAPDDASARMYGRSFSFEWYWLAATLRDTMSIPPESFPRVINAVAVGAATAGDVLLMIALALVIPLDAAVLTTLLWRFTPEVWEVGTYAHPWTLALPIFFGATIVAGTRAHRQWAVAAGAVLFFAAFAMRGDTLLLVPVVLAVARHHRRESFRPVLVASLCGALAFLATQQVLAGTELFHVVTTSGGSSAGLRTWAVNLGIFSIGAGLGSIAALVIGGATLLGKETVRGELPLLAVALLPTFALWIPIGAPARHFGPAYLVLAALLACVLVTRFRGRVLPGLIAGGLIASNAVIGELAFIGLSHRPFQSVQVGEGRRVVEGVPLGNVWSNHQAKARMNALENAYVAWTLRCSADGVPTVFAQESPYLLVMQASLKYGRPSIARSGLYAFGAATPRLWVADIPESGSLSWWTDLQAQAASQRDIVLLGPRIPKWLGDAWQRQHAGPSSAAERPESIAIRPCPSGADHHRSFTD
jgi:hypothetical protein